ncbi:MAG: hypothetical protein AAFU85_14780 [Planctomycetota bacterium]
MTRYLAFAVAAIIATSVQAHFPWLTVDKEGQVSFFFGEDVSDCTYKLPPTIAKAEIMMTTGGDASKVETKTIETDDFLGMKSKGSVPAEAHVMASTTFGVYHGAKLQYYTQYLGGEMPKSFGDCKPFEKLDLQAHAVDVDGGVDVYILWKGKPLADAEVKLFCDDGHEEGNETTNSDGKVSFNDKQVEDGINGIVVGYTVADETGKFGDQEYKSAMHYLTATFYDPEDK